jgi:hypothetical protein
VAAKKKRRHQPPRHVTVPSKVQKKAQALGAQIQQLNAQAQALGAQLQQYLSGWATGVGIDIDKGDWHFPADYSELRAGKPPEPQVVDMKDILAARDARQKREKKKA